MARFASEAELETFLGRLDPDYSQFASTLWQNGVRTARQLANATKPLLLSYGLPELYIDDINATADTTDIDAVDAETNETPVRSFKVPRNHQGKLFLDGIEKALANRGLVLLGIGEDVFPAHKDGWTMNTFNASPVQLIVGPKPVEDEQFKIRDLMMKRLTLLVTVCTAVVGGVFYIIWRRSSGIPSSG